VKEEDGIRSGLPFKKGVRLINRDVAAFAFFLLLSFFLWYLNYLGKESETGISYPVRFVNLPKDKVIADKIPSDLSLALKGPGYSILKLKVSGNKSPLVIDISKTSYRRTPGNKSQSYYLLTSTLVKSLGIQLRSGCEITSVKPDTLFFSFDKLISKSGNLESHEGNVQGK